MYFPVQYLIWHYTYGLPHLFSITKEFIRFIYNLFSINLFLRTLFKPMFSVSTSWKGKELTPEIFSILASNLMLRIIGLILRLVMIFLGLLGITLTILCMLCAAIIWLLLPVLFAFSVYASFISITHLYE